MHKTMVVVDLDSQMVRLLMLSGDGVEQLRATLPQQSPELLLATLGQLLEALSEMLPQPLSVVLSVDAWGVSRGFSFSDGCEEEACTAGHLDCPYAEAQFARMRRRAEAER